MGKRNECLSSDRRLVCSPTLAVLRRGKQANSALFSLGFIFHLSNINLVPLPPRPPSHLSLLLILVTVAAEHQIGRG